MRGRFQHPGQAALLMVLILIAGYALVMHVASGSPFWDIARDVWRIQMSPARLLVDFTALNEAAALLNAVLVAALGLALTRMTGVRLSGPTVAAFFTLFGFGLFGKTVVNAAPIVAGVMLAERIAHKRSGEYLLIALFGTALGPVVSLVAGELGIPAGASAVAGLAAGLAVGYILPGVAIAMLRLHQGFSLYNMGLATGFFALFIAALVLGPGDWPGALSIVNSNPSALLRAFPFVLSGGLIVFALAARLAEEDRSSVLGQLAGIMRQPGRLPADFVDSHGWRASILNMGILGLVFAALPAALGTPLNGPVIGAVCTVLGFAPFGKHLRNTIPIAAGVFLMAAVYGLPVAGVGVVLSALFGTTLAPLAGQFGPIIGIVAGAIHLSMVVHTGAWHLGLSLYNNGLAGGLTATFLVAVIEWHRSNKSQEVVARPGSFSRQKDKA